MPLQYQSKYSLRNEHTDSIYAIAFSPDGMYVASGSVDKRVVVWCLASGRPMHRLVTRSAVLCLIWPSNLSRIICGTEDGTLITIAFEEDTIIASGFNAHANPIERLSMNTDLTASRHLASAAHSVVKVWTWSDSDHANWGYGDVLTPPHATPFSAGKPIIVTSVQWMEEPSADCLVTSYLYHGIVCSRLSSASTEVLWSIHLPLCGHSVVSHTNHSIAVCNISTGFDIYSVPSGLHDVTLELPAVERPGMVLPIIFIHSGTMLLGGTNCGKLRMWDARSGKVIQTLRHQDMSLIQSIAAYEGDRFMIASGTSALDVPSVVQVWETRDVAE